MTPNITKGQTDTSKFIGKGPASEDANPNKNPVQEYNPAPGANAPALSSDGAIGKQFTAEQHTAEDRRPAGPAWSHRAGIQGGWRPWRHNE
ncbi:hypothetical protein, variant [Phialophora macrospora]|uniref:Uncharacterized protein n=1 Tax=Phialophora macrospora TaxID=1851006 RepID=A0A0D2CWU7_9EURO|nr:hypothetical protein, variant [Phialophora macrospora]